MGNSAVDASATLKFIDALQDRHFGEIEVFRTEEGRFVMRIKRTHIVGDSRHAFFRRAVEWVQREPCRFVVPIMHLRTEVERGLCIQFEASEIYSEYFNFTFLDLLRTKKDLEEPELWFILESLLTLTTTLRENKLAMKMKADNIFITLKGVPCVYFHHFLPFEESIIYSDYSMGQQIAIILIQLCTGAQIQQSEESDNKSLLPLVSKICARYKLLGRVIKQLLNREKTEEEMLQQFSSLVQTGKINKFTEIKLNKFRYAIPEQSSEKPAQSEPAESQKRKANNPPVSFKPKKSTDQSKKNMLKSEGNLENEPAAKDQLKAKQEELKKKLNEMVPKKQQTERLFDDLLKRKEDCKAKMERIASKKQSLALQSDKENKIAKGAPRKDSEPKKGRERRLTEASKCSNCR